ncbi:tRNA-(ms[2]io[6]A)-hydroxylase [Marinagarivorans algicola]|uniref:tRNA-(ms[2]io[6]A)-hydroxylase n=1 Tax=Marinagarivorans algicola TaxID=1513270 RepID=UPI0006B4F237|nr:tRNA isopentenyl-2-thiomethyl-A-37 hydroxylase MiaE [Marinagarivorans algicola]
MPIQAIHDFLLCETPDSWVAQAVNMQDVLLVDHANCEKKAASTAMNLMYRYVDNFDLLHKMSRLAREELRHFEQVIEFIEKRGIVYDVTINAGRYAAKMRKPVRTFEPAKLVDTLIVGAIIEARSCERFAKLAPHLDEELQKFYLSLLKSESRHFMDYLSLAREAAGEDIAERVQVFLALEKELIESEDDEFRFHSGVPTKLASAV